MDTGIEPYSDQYFSERNGEDCARINASDACTALNADRNTKATSFISHRWAIKGKTREEVKEMTQVYEDKQQTFDKGHRVEPKILDTYGTLTGKKIIKSTYYLSITHPDLYGATPDGVCTEDDGTKYGIECQHTSVESTMKVIDYPHHMQMQHQMLVTNFPYIDYVKAYIPKDTDIIKYIIIIRVYKSELYITWMVERYEWVIESIRKGEILRPNTYLCSNKYPSPVIYDIIRKYIKIDEVPISC